MDKPTSSDHHTVSRGPYEASELFISVARTVAILLAGVWVLILMSM